LFSLFIANEFYFNNKYNSMT